MARAAAITSCPTNLTPEPTGNATPLSRHRNPGLHACRITIESMMETPLFRNSSDDRLRALDVILQAWEDGADSGIAPELIAYAAIYTSLTDLVGVFGERHVAVLMESLKARVLSGEFTLSRTTQ